MEFIKNNWVLLLVIVLIIILIVRVAMRRNGSETTMNFNTAIPPIFSTSNGTIISSGSGGTQQSTQPIIGTGVYSRQLTNVYKSKSATFGNLDTYYSYKQDEFIGTYLATESIWTKITLANPTRIGYVLTSNVYFK